jgi:2-polyprenyl-6-methoxyphenol hydroxylase-like FAD-dependent oxidoreductase
MTSVSTHPPGRASDADIVIVGGGPVGLMLASELRLGGADPVVLERLPGISEIPKGNGLVGQIVPTLDYRGLLDRLRQEATWAGPVPDNLAANKTPAIRRWARRENAEPKAA